MKNNAEYTKTTSFYNTQEVFEKYLGSTSYYTSLQEAASKIISFQSPKSILDLGCGTGDTIFRIARENPACTCFAVDMREEMVALLKDKCNNEDLKNIFVKQAELCDYVEKSERKYQFISMLYSFHHIPDPLKEKESFLVAAYEALETGGLLFIGETFVPDSAADLDDMPAIQELWERRALEGYSSTFWNSLEGLDEEAVSRSRSIANYCMDLERRAGTAVENRDNEYLVKVGWVVQVATEIGYQIIISEPINSVGEHVILLKK